MEILIEPLQYVFMQRGLIQVMLMGTICGAMGAFIVARGLGFIGDAVAHAIFPGVVIAYLYNFSLSLGALLFGILTAFGIGIVSRNRRLKEDTAIGVLFAGMFALGVVLISSTRTYKADLGALLFGNVLGVSNEDLIITFALGAVVLADTRRLADSFVPLDYFEARGAPFVVAVNHFAGSYHYPITEVRDALGVVDGIPVLDCDARDRQSVKIVLVALLRHVYDARRAALVRQPVSSVESFTSR